MKLKCALIDDEPLALDLLESYVRKTPFLSLEGRYSSGVQALDKLLEAPVDLLFLDIQMPGLDGMEFSKMIKDRCRIVFTTAFSQYALDGYKAEALDYLLKPISYGDFLEASEKALKWFSRIEGSVKTAIAAPAAKEKIFVKSEYKIIGIDVRKILFVESLKDYVKIYTEDRSEPVLSLMSMRSVEETLPQEQFIRVHRSFIVRKDKIELVDRGRIVFGSRFIPVGDNYRDDFMNFIQGR